MRHREEEDAADVHGHITSLSVLRPYRRLKIAEELMKQAGIFACKYETLLTIHRVRIRSRLQSKIHFAACAS